MTIKFTEQNSQTHTFNDNVSVAGPTGPVNSITTEERPSPREALAAVAGNQVKMIEHPGANRLLSQVAAETGDALRGVDIYNLNAIPTLLQDGRLVQPDYDFLRTWVENHIHFYRVKKSDDKTEMVYYSLSKVNTLGIFKASQFLSRLRRIEQVNQCQLPVLRPDGSLTLLPHGYDELTQTLTLDPGFAINEEMNAEQAISYIEDLLGEFKFPDTARSKGVAIAGMIGLFVTSMLPSGSLRPCFVVVANAEGAGKTLLVKSITHPVFGRISVGSMPDRDEEIEKRISSFLIKGEKLLVFDNVRGRLDSPALEALLTAPNWNGRLLGRSEPIDVPNLSTVFITGNGLTVTPDLRRRSLFINLMLRVERAEEQVFNRLLDDEVLTGMRPDTLSALWALVRHWDSNGRPDFKEPSHSAFPRWAALVGGIMQAAGLECDFTPPRLQGLLDTETDDMRRLIEIMSMENPVVNFHDLATLAYRIGVFEDILGTYDRLGPLEDLEDMDNPGMQYEPPLNLTRSQKSKLASLLGRYQDRQIGNHIFRVTGQGRDRRYTVEPIGSEPA